MGAAPSMKSGTLIVRVAVITADGIYWRTYEHAPGCELDAAISRALSSCGMASAWVWGSLND
jgi:hypothetical protein